MSTVIATSPDSKFVKLARTPSGTLFRKEILKVGESFVHPNDHKKKIHIDLAFAQKLVENFQAGYCDTVQFPEVDESNRHSESPSANRGEVVDLTFDDEGIYATIDVRRNPEDVGITLLGASAMMSLDYTDTRTGRHVGPTLLHVAGTNRPYITNLKPYERAIALSAADTDGEVVMLTHTEETMELDEMLSVLKEEHEIDVIGLQAALTAAESALAEGPAPVDNSELIAALSAVLKAADPDLVQLSADEEDITVKDVAEAIVELSRTKVVADEQIVALTGRLAALEEDTAERDVDQKVHDGYILPKNRDAMLELRLSNSDMYERLLPESPIVSLSEDGVTTHDRIGNTAYDNLESEVERLSGKVKDIG